MFSFKQLLIALKTYKVDHKDFRLLEVQYRSRIVLVGTVVNIDLLIVIRVVLC